MLSLKQMIPSRVGRSVRILILEFRKVTWWVGRSIRSIILQYRKVTWRSRSLPDFIIIGAMKSGTTSLYAYLRDHPQLLPSRWKEVQFFNGGMNPNIDNFEKGQAWYRAHFPLRRNLRPHSKTYEASPLYLFNPLVPRRIFDLIPEVKMIAVLRNPTERAISHYFYEKRMGRESLPIKEALQEEEERLKSVIKNKDYKNSNYINYSYKSRGLYKKQLEKFLNYFPWRQILVLSSEELFNEPEKTLRRVFDFVGVNTSFKVKDLKPRNVASNRSEVDPNVYEYLNNYFLPHNQALYELVGKNYRWEKQNKKT